MNIGTYRVGLQNQEAIRLPVFLEFTFPGSTQTRFVMYPMGFEYGVEIQFRDTDREGIPAFFISYEEWRDRELSLELFTEKRCNYYAKNP